MPPRAKADPTTAAFVVVVSFKDASGQHDSGSVVKFPIVTAAERQEIATLLNYGVIKAKG